MKKVHPVTRYAKAVAGGKILAGEMVRLACARHLRDIERQNTAGFPYRFDEGLATKAFDFFEFDLCHYEGELDGEPFMLLDWQMFVLGSLYGWVKRTGYRRFKKAFVLTGKGSGKTPMFAGMALYALTEDGEPGAQVYCAATTREQAALAFKDARAMARKSPLIAGKVHITEHAITIGDSYFQTVSSEAGNLHGKRPHFGLVDEIHVAQNDDVVEYLQAGVKARRQPMIAMPTNAGQDRRSIAWRYTEYSKRILTGALVDDEWFAYVCQLDVCAAHVVDGRDMPVDDCPDCDQWADERVWLKVNPSLEVTPGIEYLRGQVNEARGMPAKADNVKRLNFCIWTSGKVQWIRPEVWQAQEPQRPLDGRHCFAGYDLSAVNDITAAAYVFPDEDGIDILLRCFLPEERVDALAQASRVPYRAWVDAGLITLNPGKTVDYDFVLAEDAKIREQFDVRAGGIDPWQSIQFRAKLEAAGTGIQTVPQNNIRLDAVVGEAERLLINGGFRHGRHPVLDWVASNVVLNVDPRGNRKLDKDASPEKIDPMAAILNALHEAMKDAEVEYDWVVS